MKNFCTISDKDYLLKVLTLFDSLEKTHEPDSFVLNLICLDEETYDKALALEKQTLKPIRVGDLEEDNYELRALRYAQPSQEAISNAGAQGKDPKYIQFCWALAAYSCWYFLERKKMDHIYYLDSDLFFYNDIQAMKDEIGDKSVGIVRHRIDYLPSSGEFNVGVVYFANDYIGRRCSDWWKRQMCNPGPQNPWFAWYGQCGDQKYLELFPLIFGDSVCIVDDKVGHLAPWNATFHKYKDDTKDNTVIWNGVDQPLVYFHFAHFVPNFENDFYKTSYNNEWVWGAPEAAHPFVLHKYNEYFDATKAAKEKYFGE